MRTTGQTGDQNITLSVPRTCNAFWPGAKDTTTYWQIFKGEEVFVPYSSQDQSERSFRIMGGNIAFENTVRSSAAQNLIGFVYPSQLVLRNGGSFIVDHGELEIADYRAATSNATGRVYVEESSSLVMSNANLRVGAGNLGGLLWVGGGTVSFTNAALWAGSTDGNPVGGGNGYVRVDGGTVSLRAEVNTDAYVALGIGGGAGYSSLHVSGGSVVSRCTGYTDKITARSSTVKDAISDVYLDGGLVDLKNLRTSVGFWSEAGNGRAALTVDGTARAEIALIGQGCGADNGGVSVVNLNGGTLRTTKGFADYGKTSERWFNLNGGTLELASAVKIFDKPRKVVYPGGATLDVPAGEIGIVSSSTFPVAGGWGVESIALASGGSGYVTAPLVTIAGGSGSNATAYAVLKKDGSVGRLVVTCRGEGYASGDALTVSIVGATGSGAAAGAVTLTENTLPTITKTGAGDLRLGGTNDFAGKLELAEGDLSSSGGGAFKSLARLHIGDLARVCPTRAEAEGATDVMSLSRLDLSGGLAYGCARWSANYKGFAKLAIGTLSREPDGILAITEDDTLLSVASTEEVVEKVAHPLVHGLIALGGTSVGQRVLHAYERNPTTGELTLANWTSAGGPGPGVNYFASNGTYDCTAVNAIYIPWQASREVYLRNDGPIEIESGLILSGRNNAVREFGRIDVTGTGACLTTRAKNGLLIYEDSAAARSYSPANGKVVFAANDRHFILGSIRNPSVAQSIPVTVAGPRPSRPDKGVQAWLIGSDNDYSGGLYLVNGGVVVGGEKGLGRAECPVTVSGLSMIAFRMTVSQIGARRAVRVRAGSVLMFSAENESVDFRGDVEGAGDLLTSDISWGQTMTFGGGDHSKFAGTYYVLGCTRPAAGVLSGQAGICLADGTNGVGVIETSGSFVRTPGTGKGQICWRNHATLASYGLRGGFSARGGALTVNLGNDARKLVPGSDYLPSGAIIQLQSPGATAALTLANGFELNGHVQKVNVRESKSATLTGALSDATGGGRLDVTGNLAFAGALEVSSATLAANAPLLTVAGALDLTGSQVDLQVSAAELAARGETPLPIATATGGVTGVPTAKGALPEGWKLKVRGGRLLLDRVRGMAMIVR